MTPAERAHWADRRMRLRRRIVKIMDRLDLPSNAEIPGRQKAQLLTVRVDRRVSHETG